MAAAAKADNAEKIAHLEQLKKNRQENIKSLDNYAGDPAHKDEAKGRYEAEIKQIDAEIKALKKE